MVKRHTKEQHEQIKRPKTHENSHVLQRIAHVRRNNQRSKNNTSTTLSTWKPSIQTYLQKNTFKHPKQIQDVKHEHRRLRNTHTHTRYISHHTRHTSHTTHDDATHSTQNTPHKLHPTHHSHILHIISSACTHHHWGEVFRSITCLQKPVLP